jgi:hypothetical protein
MKRPLIILSAAALLLGGCEPRAYSRGEVVRRCADSFRDLYRWEGNLYIADPLGASRLAKDADLNQVCPAQGGRR